MRLIDQAYHLNTQYLQQTVLELTTQVNEQETIVSSKIKKTTTYTLYTLDRRADIEVG